MSVAVPAMADAQSTDQTGLRLTDFNDVLSLSQFNPAQGQLVQANFTISGNFQSEVLQILNSSNEVADFDVSTHVGLCADRMSVLSSLSYEACSATSTPTSLNLTTTALQEQFPNLAPGGQDSSATPLQATNASSSSVTDIAALADFTGTGTVNFGVASLAGFQANGAGGNSTVQVKTSADVSISVDYRYADVSIVTTTNGTDGVSLTPGAATTWDYLVTNTGNVDLSTLDVTDNLGGLICTIPFLASGASNTCTTTGIAGGQDYDNVGTVSGVPTINPAITVTDNDPTSYVVVASVVPAETTNTTGTNAAPETTSPDTAEEDFGGLENANIDVELTTNGTQADTGSGPSVTSGSDVELTYVVTNNGTVDLTNVIVVDDAGIEVCRQASLAVANTFECTVTVVATCGEHAHTAQVKGQSSSGTTVSDTDPTAHNSNCNASAIQSPSITETLAVAETPPVVQTTSQPAVPQAQVLAFTGIEDGPTRLAFSAFGLGFAALAASEGLRRRSSRLVD